MKVVWWIHLGFIYSAQQFRGPLPVKLHKWNFKYREWNDRKLKQTYMLEGWRMRSEICLESWWELRTIMLCKVAGCWGMLIMIAPTLKTAALLVLRPRWALYKAWDLAMLHFTTVLKHRVNLNEQQDRRFYSCFFFFSDVVDIWMDMKLEWKYLVTSNTETPCRFRTVFTFLSTGEQ